MIDESQQVMKEFKGSAALDAGLIASAQAVEHYEISRYGTLKAWAEQLGLQQAMSLLDETLEEEKKTGAPSTELAKAPVNQEPQQAADSPLAAAAGPDFGPRRDPDAVRRNAFARPAGDCRELSG